MLKQASTQLAFQFTRNFSTSKQNNFKVAVCGAAGGIGQPLSLLLKLNPLVTELSLYDIQGTPGVAADLSHIDTASCVTGHKGPEQLADALKDSDIVTIPAGVPRKPGMTRDDLFDKNASVVRDLTEAFSKYSPKAILAVITNPINSVLPIAVEILKKNKTYNKKRVFGVSTLDSVRSRKFVSEILNVDPQKVCIPVVAGHSGVTIIPLFSQCKPEYCGEVVKLTKRVQEAGTEVVNAKAGAGSATLSMAYSGCLFIDSILRGLNGEKDVVECAFIESDVCDAVPYFATPLRFGKEGLEKNLGIPEMNDFETEQLRKALPDLAKNIKRGIDYVKKKKC